MPAFINHNVSGGVPRTTGPKVVALDENTPVFPERNYTISGVTKDSTGAALGACAVKLFYTATDILAQTTVSDASGNYSFTVDKTVSFYEVSYKAGAPDVAGTSVNTLVGA